jgi:hypothetical protein
VRTSFGLIVLASLMSGCTSVPSEAWVPLGTAGYEDDDGPSRADLPPAPARPRDPWVLPCMLDEQPGVLLIALGEGLCLAYDMQSCTLSKAWRGDVSFEVPVGATMHSPQAISLGEDLHDPLAGSKWFVASGEPARAEFAGYTLDESRVTLHWKLRAPRGAHHAPGDPPLASVQETPEVARDSKGRLILLRLFEVSSPPEQSFSLLAPMRPESVKEYQDFTSGWPRDSELLEREGIGWHGPRMAAGIGLIQVIYKTQSTR